MRYARIFFLFFEHVYQYRSRIFIYFLIALLSPLIFLLYWRGVYLSSGEIFAGWSFSRIASYYFLFIIAGGLLLVHVEEDAEEDIHEGNLASFLVKPFSYFWMKFCSELPWRLIQGLFGCVAFLILITLYGRFVQISLSLDRIIPIFIIIVLGYMLSFIFKMIILLCAFWTTDISGLRQLADIVLFIFAGFVVPIHFLPDWLYRFTLFLPFPYMIYFPVRALLGDMSVPELTETIVIQIAWIGILIILYRALWTAGTKKFSAVGR